VSTRDSVTIQCLFSSSGYEPFFGDGHKRSHELQENIAAEGSPAVGETIQRTIVIGGRQFSFRAFGVPGGKTSVGTVVEGVSQRNVDEP
jgi:hypothetical protein